MPAASVKSFALILTLGVALACGTTPPSGSGDPTPSPTSVDPVTETDVPYTPPPGGNAAVSRLDVYYVPDGKPKKLLFFVHGGSWVGGDKSNLATSEDMIAWFLERDYVVAAPNFRLASPIGQPLQVTYAEQLTDITYALAWLRAHQADYGIAEPGTVVLGYSSGAHLAAMLAADSRYLQSAGLSSQELAAAISFDVHAYDVPYALELMPGSDVEQNIPLIEHLFGTTESEQLAGSPSHYAASTDVPRSLLVSAEPSDTPGSHGWISSLTTEAYAQLLQNHGHEARWVHFDDETHNSLVADFGIPGDGPTAAVEQFLE